MKKYKVPVTWMSYGEVVVEAESPEEAMEVARDVEGVIPIPTDWEYIEGSWALSCDSPEIMLVMIQEV